MTATPYAAHIGLVVEGPGDAAAVPVLLRRHLHGMGDHRDTDRSFEDWIFASGETLDLGLTYDEKTSGTRAITEALRPAKYVKPTWQPRLAHRVDIAVAAERNGSLRRMLARFEALVPLTVEDGNG